MNLKEAWEKFYFFVWKDDSPKGWLITFIFLFILIKFIFFPTLSFVTGTALPLAIVESCSMYHEGNYISNYDTWWNHWEEKYENLDVTKEQFSEFKFKRGFTKGDILFIIKAKPEKIKIGDVIIFDAGRGNPIIHRVIKITEENNEKTFTTIGDNVGIVQSFETKISEDQLVGKAVLRIVPYAGWMKLIFFEHLRPEYEKGFCDQN
jgi:signal peptidase I